MKRLTIKQCCIEGFEDDKPDENGFVFGKYFEFELQDTVTGDLLWKDSISDTGQGIDQATRQIERILTRAGHIVAQ